MILKAKNHLTFFCLSLLFGTRGWAQLNGAGNFKKDNKITVEEKGFYPLYNYNTKTYHALPQNWAIVQDKRGILYFGNNEGGVLEYDGVTWRMIKVTNETNVRSLALDGKGRVYVGAAGEIGYLEPDAHGNMAYVSLLSHIAKEDRDFSDVWSTLATPEGIYFQAEDKIFLWNGTRITVWKAEKSFHRIFYVNGHLFARQREVGLMEIKNGSLVPLKGGEAFADESIYAMVPYGENGSKDILLCTRTKGLFILKPDSGKAEGNAFTLQNFPTQVDPFLMQNICYHLLKLDPGFSVATVTKGSVIVDLNGRFLTFLNKDMGLQDETIYSQYSDASGNLWLATGNGISRVNLGSPVTYFSDKNGLNGTVQTILRHNGSLFAATTLGVYVLRPGSISGGSEFTPSHFEKLNSINEECWDLLSFRSGKYSTLLGVSSGNLFSIDNQFNKKEILQCKPWVIRQSSFDSSRIFVGMENGLASIYWDGNQWTVEPAVPEIKENVISIAEDKNGNLWLGLINGVIKVSFKDRSGKKPLPQMVSSVLKFDAAAGLPEGTVEIAGINGTVLFGTTRGIFTFTGNRFMADTSYGKIFSDGSRQVHRMSFNPFSSTIWVDSYITDKRKFEFGFLKKENGKYAITSTQFLPYSDEVIHSFYHEKNGITWFGGVAGIYRYDPSLDQNKELEYNALVRRVTIGKDSTLFNGTYYDSAQAGSLLQNASLKPNLPFSYNSVIVEFAAPDFVHETSQLYQYYMDGFDKDWSAWKHETKAVYTNLPEGSYVFHVRSKNIFNKESREATYEFSVLPPWYRTWWAYVLYLLSSVGFIWGVVTYFSRGLKAIIRERTAEIVKQKEEIEYKNRNITDSINYAKRIQEAILPHYELMSSRFPESFIVYRPKDIVAGDFYWFAEKEGKFIVAACDCTGHGVPGAFMSLIGYSLLNEVLLEKTFSDPANALDSMKRGIIKSLGQTGVEGEQKDGMDMSLVTLEPHKNNGQTAQKLAYAGANNPLYLVRKGELIELNADKMPIGIYLGIDRPFTTKEMVLESGDTFYLFSDGYADQFGGKSGKKFTKKRFKEILLSLQHTPMTRQKTVLEKTLDEWLGDQQPIDDVLVIGIRIP